MTQENTIKNFVRNFALITGGIFFLPVSTYVLEHFSSSSREQCHEQLKLSRAINDDRYDFNGIIEDNKVEFANTPNTLYPTGYEDDGQQTLMVTTPEGERRQYIDRMNDLCLDDLVTDGVSFKGDADVMKRAQSQFDTYLQRILGQKKKQGLECLGRY